MTTSSPTPPLITAQTIANRYAALPQVEAVTLAGSQTSGVADSGSDIDLYVYLIADLPVSERRRIASTESRDPEVDNQFWESGDEWVDAPSGVHVDVMFRSTAWIEEQLDRVLNRCQASVGYSTCFWDNVLVSRALFDRYGWFAGVQESARKPYPDELRRAIVAKNYPILRGTHSSYLYQISRAVSRGDWVSVNHRIAALLASVFDILSAVNRLPHPGEKRLLAIVEARCAKVPEGFSEQVNALVKGDGNLVEGVKDLLNGLDQLLVEEGLV
ncbi:MAG: DUF4037 domain-containing protein [Anaerolineales bacterium]|nr:DUF4037 domain-containing protein [Anaerolineales bacterium]